MLKAVPIPETRSPTFLAGGGEMGALMRALDWSKSPLGVPETWPQSLRTAVRLLLNTGHPMYIFWGITGACLYNDAYRRSIGPEQHPSSLGRSAHEVWDEIWDIVGPQIAQIMAGGGATWHEDQFIPITRNGRRDDVYWTYSYSPIDDEGAPNGVGGVVVICAETTQKVLSEQRLASDMERQQRLFQRAPGFIAILHGPDHIFEFVNDAYIRLMGERNFIGRSARDVVPEVSDQGFFEVLDQVYRTRERFVAQRTSVLLQRQSGQAKEERFVDLIFEPVIGESGSITGIFVEGFDVTERVQAELGLHESEKQLRISREHLSRAQRIGQIGSFEIDLRTMARSWSDECYRIFGIEPGTPIPTDFLLDHIVPEDRHLTVEYLEDARQGRPLASVEYRIARSDGSVRTLLRDSEIIRDPDGAPATLLGIIRDVTESRAEGKRQQEFETHLQHSQRLEALGTLASGMAHDLNNTLVPIIALVPMMMKRAEPGSRDYHDLEVLKIAGDRARRLVRQVLQFCRAEGTQRQTISLASHIREVLVMMRSTLPATIHIVEEIEDVPEIWGDPAQLYQVFLNLITNAAQAIGDKPGRICVTLSMEDDAGKEGNPADTIRFSVTDNGRGIPEDALSRVFEPFFTTKSVGEGSGLGLSVVHGIVASHGGRISVRSQVGIGTTFDVYLPVKHSEDSPLEALSGDATSLQLIS